MEIWQKLNTNQYWEISITEIVNYYIFPYLKNIILYNHG